MADSNDETRLIVIYIDFISLLVDHETSKVFQLLLIMASSAVYPAVYKLFTAHGYKNTAKIFSKETNVAEKSLLTKDDLDLIYSAYKVDCDKHI